MIRAVGGTAACVLAAVAGLVVAGPDDDAPFTSDLKARNAIDPVQHDAGLADFPTNVDRRTGLRLSPPTGSTLIVGQRFDLRIETQMPGDVAPDSLRLTVNGEDVTTAFVAAVARQGEGPESGTPASPKLFGMTARNVVFDAPGRYRIQATVDVDGVTARVENVVDVHRVFVDGAVTRIVFFLGDGMGQPMRTAARILSRGLFEGRARGRLAMDGAEAIGLVMTASFDSTITDSAPGMANYVTGVKQPNNALNVSVDNTPENGLDNPRVETLMEYLHRVHGWRLGVVTDAYAVDATPAAATAHVRSRSDRDAIAQQMLGHFADGTPQPATGYRALADLVAPPDVLLGGGARYFVEGAHPDLAAFWQSSKPGRPQGAGDLFFDVAPARGYQTVRDRAGLESIDPARPVLGLFGGDGRLGQTGLGDANLPAALDRLVAAGRATIGGRSPADPELGLDVTPAGGTACGASVRACFAGVPSKREMVETAIDVLETRSGGGGWMLLVEQSQIDKLAHTLELERAIYEVIELDDAVAAARTRLASFDDALVIVTADHAQPESVIGVTVTGAVAADGATPPGGCFVTDDGGYPIVLGYDDAHGGRPCPLQDVLGTFNDATFPTYVDADEDGYPDDPDPAVKLAIEQAGRPTYTTDFLTNPVPKAPTAVATGGTAAQPNPERDPHGLLLTGNLPTGAVAGAAPKGGGVPVAPHSADDVPLMAFGAGAALFSGVYENSDVHVRLGAALSGRASLPAVDRPAAGRLRFDAQREEAR